MGRPANDPFRERTYTPPVDRDISLDPEDTMNRMLASVLLPLSLLAVLPALAHEPAKKQDAPPKMSAEQAAMMEAYRKAGALGEVHAALAKMAGTYDLSIRSWDAPGAPPTVETGTATRSMALGGRVMVEDVQSQMHGQAFTGHGMHGYDNVTGRHWSTWNDSMSTGIMVSDGDCDAKGACTFTGSWHDPVTKKQIKSRMTSRWTSPDVEVFEMHVPGPDGKEFRMMEITYTRR
jgi:hypothetical protein